MMPLLTREAADSWQPVDTGRGRAGSFPRVLGGGRGPAGTVTLAFWRPALGQDVPGAQPVGLGFLAVAAMGACCCPQVSSVKSCIARERPACSGVLSLCCAEAL